MKSNAAEIKKRTQKKTTSSKSNIKKSTKLVPITKEYIDLPIDKLNGNFIDTGTLMSMTIDSEEETIYFNESWPELIVLLLSFLYVDNQGKFLTLLLNADILNISFKVSEKIEYDESRIKQYKIPNSNYYFETDMQGKNLAKSIKNLVKLLNIEKRGLKLFIVPKGTEDQYIKDKETITFSLFEAYQHNYEDLALKSISIMNKEFNCKNSSDPSVYMLHWLYKTQKTFWKDNLDKLNIDRKFIIATDLKEIEKSKILGEVFKIPDTDYYFSKKYSESIEADYLLYLCKLFNISPLLISLTFEKKDGAS